MDQAVVNAFIAAAVMCVTAAFGFFAARWVRMLDETLREFRTDLKISVDGLSKAVGHLDKRIDDHERDLRDHDVKLINLTNLRRKIEDCPFADATDPHLMVQHRRTADG